MLFPSRVLPGLADGTVTVAFRRWTRPSVKAGGTLVTVAGQLAIDDVAAIDPEDITDEDARAAGYPSAADVLGDLRPHGTLYRIRFHRAGEDPRIELRARSDVSDEELAALRERLGRVAWAVATLRLIADHPATVSTELAARVGVERTRFKQRVRRLKAQGLTVSLDTGYRLSPRGEAVLARLERGASVHTNTVLANAPVSAALPAKDLARAKRFYSEVLGLPLKTETSDNAAFECGGGTLVFVFASPNAGTNQATAAGWMVDDLEATLAELRQRGVEFEEYDLPGLKTADGVATFGSNKVAYFKDTEGNILSIGQTG